jgi:hypothetical protein
MDVIGRIVRGGRAPRRLRLGAVGVMTLLLGAGFVACTPPAGDVEVTYAGGNVGTPSGDVRADFANVGTAPLEGRITVTAAVASGPLEFTNAAFFSGGAPGDGGPFTPVGPEISPDGKHLTFHLDGTLAVGSRYQVRIYFKDNFIGPPHGGAPSQYQVSFSHPDDVNLANNSFDVPFA